jgi:hypothetical protein
MSERLPVIEEAGDLREQMRHQVARDGVEVGTAIVVEIGNPVPTGRRATTACRSPSLRSRRRRSFPRIAVVGIRLARKIRDVDVRPAGTEGIADRDPHPGARLGAPGAGTRLLRDVLESALAAIAVEAVRHAVVGDEEVGPAVSVVVEENRARPLPSRIVGRRNGRGVLEAAAGGLSEEDSLLARIVLGIRIWNCGKERSFSGVVSR